MAQGPGFMVDRPIVFVVDEDAGVRRWLQALLEDADYTVRAFATGRGFIDAYRDAEPGCLIAEIRLPDMSGVDLQKWLTARAAPVPVILITGHGDVTIAVQAMQAGAVDFIEKPASNITILDAVRRALARTAALRGNAELQPRVDQQRAIAHLSALALAGGDLQVLLDEAVKLVARTIGVAFCSILERGGTRDEMTARAGVGWPDGILGKAIVPSAPGSLIGAALASTEPITFLDLAAETRFEPGRILQGCGIVSGLTVNIPGIARPYGTLGAYTDKMRSFSADEIDFVRMLANIVGQAVARKQTEESLSRAQKMEAIGLLTGGIAHDFNNLLTVVLGNAQLAASMVEEGSELHAINTEIEAAARRGADLTHRLLAFSRRQPLRPATLDPAALVFGMRNLLARVLDPNVEIEVLTDDAPWQVHADAIQLESALLNLAINARDAMPEGGRLIIELRNAEIDAAYAATDPELKAGPYVVISVSDTGTGMPPEIVSRAFEPFFTTKPVGKGSGLGLSMVYGFARQSGGCVELHSEPGHGTVVRIYLPRAGAAKPGAAQPDAAVQSVPHGRETILVVEDDDQVRRYVVRQLRLLGYSVTHVSDGPTALEQLRSAAAIDLLFVDVIMPGGMNGFEVALAARRLRPGLPVLMASGYPDAALSRHGDALPGVGLLRKPYQVGELARALRSALEPVPQSESDQAGTT